MNKIFKMLICAMTVSALILVSGCNETSEKSAENVTTNNQTSEKSAENITTNNEALKSAGNTSTNEKIKPVSMKLSLSQEKFPTFTTYSLNEHMISSDIFAQKKLTVINIWGTFCPPCIAEMPELGSWVREMPSDVQLIGIVCDIEDEGDDITIATAKEILAESNANFVNLIPNAEIYKLLSNVEAVPTTIFVDSDGNILSKKIVGADVDGYKEVVEDFLSSQN